MYNLEKELEKLQEQWEKVHATTVEKEMKNGLQAKEKENKSK